MKIQSELPEELAGWVADQARRDNRSVSLWVRLLIEREHGKAEKPAAPKPVPAVVPSLAALRAQTEAVVQKPKRTALPSSSDGRGGA